MERERAHEAMVEIEHAILSHWKAIPGTGSAWPGWKMIVKGWEVWNERLVAGYLSFQLNSGPFVPDKKGYTPPRQKHLTEVQIATALRKNPHTVSRALQRLKLQKRVRQLGTAGAWYATDYQLDEVAIGRIVKWRLRSLGCIPPSTRPAKWYLGVRR